MHVVHLLLLLCSIDTCYAVETIAWLIDVCDALALIVDACYAVVTIVLIDWCIMQLWQSCYAVVTIVLIDWCIKQLWLLLSLADVCFAVVTIALLDWWMLCSCDNNFDWLMHVTQLIIIVFDWRSSARMFLWTDSLLRSFDCELAWWLCSDMEGIHVQQLLLWSTMIVTISMSHSYDLGTKSDFAMAMPSSNVIPLTVSIFLIRRI
jgi:hypothetical protein